MVSVLAQHRFARQDSIELEQVFRFQPGLPAALVKAGPTWGIQADRRACFDAGCTLHLIMADKHLWAPFGVKEIVRCTNERIIRQLRAIGRRQCRPPQLRARECHQARRKAFFHDRHCHELILRQLDFRSGQEPVHYFGKSRCLAANFIKIIFKQFSIRAASRDRLDGLVSG